MFRKLFRQAKPSPPALEAKSGEIYAHVFENALTGVDRNLFWILRIDFEPVRWDGEDWESSLGVEWLTWPVHRWQDLDGKNLGQALLPEMVESSLYLVAEHHDAALHQLQLRADGTDRFEATVVGRAEIDDGSGPRPLDFSLSAPLTFTGVIIVPENLEPKPATSDEVKDAVSRFIRLDGLREPRWEGFRYVLAPDT